MAAKCLARVPYTQQLLMQPFDVTLKISAPRASGLLFLVFHFCIYQAF